jgi:hypothetical protein
MATSRTIGGWGYNEDTEMLFPMRVSPKLKDLRGTAWRELVEQIMRAPEASPEHLAFTLLLVRLSGCLTCHSDSYRAMRGCTECATHSVKRFRESDRKLIEDYEAALDEVMQYLLEQEQTSAVWNGISQREVAWQQEA